MFSNIQVAESVGSGHPDKIADTISDLILEKLLEINQEARLSCEVLAIKNLIVIAGEMSGVDIKKLEIESLVLNLLCNLNYDVSKFKVLVDIKEQSEDIASTSWRSPQGMVSGDQSSVIGYANLDTSNYLPLSHEVAKSLTQVMEESVINGEIKGAKYDCKSLVVLNGKKIEKLFFSVQHEENIDIEKFNEEIYQKVILKVLNKFHVEIDKKDLKINSSNRFVIGGLDADTGLTNRKIIVDSYGTISRNGGGGYSGKDLTKVDRLGAYYARWICKNFVAANACEFLELELIYGYGASKPCFFIKSTKSENSISRLYNCINNLFNFSFADIYMKFNKPGIKYSQLAKYGHFRNSTLPWEQLDMVDEIKKYLYEH